MRELIRYIAALATLVVAAAVDARAQEESPTIWQAAASDDIVLLQALVEEDSEVINAGDNFGNTPLHHAAWTGALEAMQWLIDKGAEIDLKSDQQWTPLHWATRNGRLPSVDLLLKHGAEVNAVGHLGQTALHLAAKNKFEKTVSRLLEAKANPNAKDINGQTPIHLAALDGYTTIVINLLEKGGDIEAKTDWGATPLSAAAARGRTSTVAALLVRDATVDPVTDAGWTPLFASVVGKFKAPTKFLRGNGADIHVVTKAKNTLLHAAASSGMDELIVELLEAGLDINAEDAGGRTPLDHATGNLWKTTPELLKSKGGKPGPKPTLHHAAFTGDLAAVKRLVSAGADLAQRDDWQLPPRNWTPLHYAAAGGDEAVIRHLILAGADVRAIDYSGWTPMVAALVNQHIDAANILKRWQSLPGIVNLRYTGQMSFDVLGVADTECEIEASTDLKKWHVVGRVKLKDGKVRFFDRRRILLPRCYYRAKVVE